MNFQDVLKQVLQTTMGKRIPSHPSGNQYPTRPGADQGVLDELDMLREQGQAADEMEGRMPMGFENVMPEIDLSPPDPMVMSELENVAGVPSQLKNSMAQQQYAMPEIDLSSSPDTMAKVMEWVKRVGLGK